MCISRILEMYSIVVAIVFRSSWVQVHLELCLVILNVVRADSGCGTVAGQQDMFRRTAWARKQMFYFWHHGISFINMTCCVIMTTGDGSFWGIQLLGSLGHTAFSNFSTLAWV